MKEIITLLKSKVKVEILEELSESVMTPSILAKKLKRPRPSISRTILELQDAGLVKCNNPEADRWREYEITVKGKTLLKKLKEFV